MGGSSVKLQAPDASPLHIGVLALQGAFGEHRQMVARLGVQTSEVRRPADLAGLDGLIIPGGESTTMGRLMGASGLTTPLRGFARKRPVLGTCAGLIMMASGTTDGGQPLLALIDATIRRNAFGRQGRSFEAPVELRLERWQPETFPGVFIRAPRVEELGPQAEVIARIDGHVVGVRQGHCVGVAFHPELTDSTRLHEYFVRLVRSQSHSASCSFTRPKAVSL